MCSCLEEILCIFVWDASLGLGQASNELEIHLKVQSITDKTLGYIIIWKTHLHLRENTAVMEGQRDKEVKLQCERIYYIILYKRDVFTIHGNLQYLWYCGICTLFDLGWWEELESLSLSIVNAAPQRNSSRAQNYSHHQGVPWSNDWK